MMALPSLRPRLACALALLFTLSACDGGTEGPVESAGGTDTGQASETGASETSVDDDHHNCGPTHGGDDDNDRVGCTPPPDDDGPVDEPSDEPLEDDDDDDDDVVDTDDEPVTPPGDDYICMQDGSFHHHPPGTCAFEGAEGETISCPAAHRCLTGDHCVGEGGAVDDGDDQANECRQMNCGTINCHESCVCAGESACVCPAMD